MAIDKVKELIRAIKTDPGAREALQGLAKPTDEDGIIQYCVEAAKLLNCDVTEADIRDAIAAMARERREKTAADVQMLPDEEVAQASGGRECSFSIHRPEPVCPENSTKDLYCPEIYKKDCGNFNKDYSV